MGSDPGRSRSRGYEGRLDRPPGWADSLLAGRSRADKEADQAILAASPIVMGLVAFLLLVMGMVLAPNVRSREREPPRPPGDPEPLRAPLVRERRPPQPPRWP
jgi:hypothetical protein